MQFKILYNLTAAPGRGAPVVDAVRAAGPAAGSQHVKGTAASESTTRMGSQSGRRTAPSAATASGSDSGGGNPSLRTRQRLRRRESVSCQSAPTRSGSQPDSDVTRLGFQVARNPSSRRPPECEPAGGWASGGVSESHRAALSVSTHAWFSLILPCPWLSVPVALAQPPFPSPVFSLSIYIL